MSEGTEREDGTEFIKPGDPESVPFGEDADGPKEAYTLMSDHEATKNGAGESPSPFTSGTITVGYPFDEAEQRVLNKLYKAQQTESSRGEKAPKHRLRRSAEAPARD